MVITKELNGVDITKKASPLLIAEGERENFQVCTLHGIGVKIDLPQESRFFVKGNRFVQNFSERSSAQTVVRASGVDGPKS